MDKRETTRLFRMLGELYPSAPEFSREESMLAWQLVLEPFDYEQVKAAAIEWARIGEKREYPPRVSELAAKLAPAQTAGKSAQAIASESGLAWQRAIDAGQCRDAAEELGSVSRYAREHGMSWEQAKEAMGA